MDRLGEGPPVTQGSDSEPREPQSKPPSRRRTDPGHEGPSLQELLERVVACYLEARAALEAAESAESAAREKAKATLRLWSQAEQRTLPPEAQGRAQGEGL